MPNDDLDRLVSDGGVVYAYAAAMCETRTDAYSYNTRNALTSATKLGGPASVPATLEYAYQYDDIGNRITSTDLGTNHTYTANNLNQYSAITTSDSGLQTSSFEPQFDDDGNQTLIQTATGVWSVTYNGENRPVLWTGGTQAAMTNIVMSFDRMGRHMEYRETQTIGAVGGKTPTTTVNAHHRFVYDGYLCIQRLDVASGNAIDLTFVWDVTEPIATRPLIVDKPEVCRACVTHDGNKNVAELANMSFAPELVAHYEYDSFGGEKMPSRFCSDGVIDFYQCNPVRYNNPIADVDVLGLRLKPEKDGRVRRYYEQVSKGVGKSSFRETYNLAAYEKAYSKFEETINEAKLFGTIDEREAVFQENELRKCCPGLRNSVLRYAHKKQEK